MKKNLWDGDITQERLRSFFYYDENSGRLYEKTRVGSRGRLVGGREIGKTVANTGYNLVSINNERYLVHRVAWLYMMGFFPENHIDHINGIKTDNRWENLREVTRTCNAQNCAVPVNNTSGYVGVMYEKQSKKWVAKLMVNRKTCYLGRYNTALEAALARITGEEWHPEFTCDSRNENRTKVMSELKNQR